jgi:uncharacterized membrane protein
MSIANYLGEKVAYHKQRSHRIEELADAVFAIVMTLLVLDIRIPIKEMNTEMSLWFSLVNTLPKILTFVLSFSVAGQFWSIFINQFNYIHISDRRENLIGLFYLMFVSLLPFSTSFLSEHLWSRVAVGFYVFNLLLILSFHTLHWLYSYRAGLVKVEENTGIVVNKAIMKRAKAAFTAYGIVAICCLFNSYLALASTILVHVIFTFGGVIEMLYWKRTQKIKSAQPILIHVASQSIAEDISDGKDQSNSTAQLS